MYKNLSGRLQELKTKEKSSSVIQKVAAVTYGSSSNGVSFFFFYFYFFCHTQRNTIIIKTIINRLTNIKFKIYKITWEERLWRGNL